MLAQSRERVKYRGFPDVRLPRQRDDDRFLVGNFRRAWFGGRLPDFHKAGFVQTQGNGEPRMETSTGPLSPVRRTWINAPGVKPRETSRWRRFASPDKSRTMPAKSTGAAAKLLTSLSILVERVFRPPVGCLHHRTPICIEPWRCALSEYWVA